MNSDHCAKEKKDARFLEKEKTLAVFQSLGEDQMLEKSAQELLPDFLEAQEQMINRVGGEQKWNNLSEVERNERQASMMEQVVVKLEKNTMKHCPRMRKES
jgi:hypothetical protein